MKLATLRDPHHGGTYAARVDTVQDSRLTVTPIPGSADLGEMLSDPSWRYRAAQASGHQRTVDRAALAPVIPHPRKIICVGLNYAQHIAEMGHETPDVPTLFVKFDEALAGPFDDIVVPEWAAPTADWEGELAVVMGETVFEASDKEAECGIAGWAIMNDFTIREAQYRTLQWHQGKSLARSSGFGPWLTLRDDWRLGGTLRTWVDGVLMQEHPTDDLVFSPARLVAAISQLYPLRPGDVIATGTPAGVGHGHHPPRYLQNGETVRIAINGLGEISNRVTSAGLPSTPA